MEPALMKSGVLMLHPLLEALNSNNATHIQNEAATLYAWLSGLEDEAGEVPLLGKALQPLAALYQRESNAQVVSLREWKSLREPLVALMHSWLGQLKCTVILGGGGPLDGTHAVRDGVTLFDLNKEPLYKAANTGDDRLQILLVPQAAAEGIDSDTSPWADIILTHEEVVENVKACLPWDTFDYDRVYMRSKLDSLSGTRNDTEMLLAGSSYSMVGLKESSMPTPAANIAANAQDPYYSLLAVEQAKKSCKRIHTVVLSSAYYFWHTDMSDNPSDYFQNAVTRVNIPVLKKNHHYNGPMRALYYREYTTPLLEAFLDFEQIRTALDKRIGDQLAALPYYNSAYQPRPAHGLLPFDFHTADPDKNEKFAQMRANGHASNYSEAHLAENMALLDAFLVKMEKRQVRVVLLVPPVTAYYRQSSSREIRDSFYAAFDLLRQQHTVTFVDLFASEDFTDADFLDYDHLNDAGADKLSALVAEMVAAPE